MHMILQHEIFVIFSISYLISFFCYRMNRLALFCLLINVSGVFMVRDISFKTAYLKVK